MTALALNTLRTMSFRFPLIHIFLLLVVAALIAGGMTVGAEISEKSYTRELASDMERYKTVYERFQLSYQAMPGDMSNASSYWQGCRYNIADCNGDGDGVITSIAEDRTTEAALAWQHLSISGLLSEQYSGDLIGDHYIPGESMPKAPYENAGYLIANRIAYHNAGWNPSHYLKVGKLANYRFETPAVSLSDAAALDHKMDDGIASEGDILAYSTQEHGCLDHYNREILVGKDVAHYATNLSSDARCSLYFRLD